MGNNISRNFKIDLLRSVGLLLIILAHVLPPEIIFRIRSFDVPLMIFISGVSFTLSYKHIPYFAYLYKRILRLLCPVWIFLTVFFIIYHERSYSTFDNILKSYTLISGIGYVWFIRIIFVFSVISPMLFYILNKIKSENKLLLLVFISFLINEVLTIFHNESPNTFFRIFILDWFGYIPLFLTGVTIFKISSYSKKIIVCFSFFSTIFLGFVFGWDIQSYKYTPHGIYITYGMFMSCFLWGFDVSETNFKYLNRFINFLSVNSIWIYLFHIVLVINYTDLNDAWFLNYFFVLIVSTSLVLVKNKLLTTVERFFKLNSILKMMLLG
ncbi:TPA: acyltransferase [Vibrio cholerae]